MTRVRRGGFIFVTWIGDHDPRHVHVYRDGQLVVKFDLDSNCPIEGYASRTLRRVIEALRREGKL